MNVNKKTNEVVELTAQQKIKEKIKELKKLESIEKQISTYQNKIDKLKAERIELSKKYNL